MEIGTYDPKKVVISYGGVEITGYAEDSFVKINPLGGGVSDKAGCSGDVVRVLSPDERHEITISLLQTSASNDYLSDIYARDKYNGDGVLPIIIKDLSGNTTFYNSSAWITKMPEATRGNKDNDNNWVLHSAGGAYYLGGTD